MSKKGKIAIVTNVKLGDSFLQGILRKNKYNVITDNNINSVFANIANNKVDLIICDLSTNPGKGLKFLKVLKEKYSRIPVITVIPYPDKDNYVLKSFELGAQDSIYKKFSDDELLLRTGRAILDSKIKNNLTKVQSELERYSKNLLNIVKHRSEELYEAEKKYEYLVQCSPNIIFLLDEDDRIIFINDTVKHILEYQPEELLGEDFYMMVHREDIEKTKRFFVNSTQIKLIKRISRFG